jgi:hypothetical protein
MYHVEVIAILIDVRVVRGVRVIGVGDVKLITDNFY